jgi:hypothetical protein
MTVPELITEILSAIRGQFYADRPRDFKRDERALTKAILRYGHECELRGWEFETDHIARELMALLNDIKTRESFRYLPLYLHGAIGRHIGQRAEELSAQAKRIPPKVAKLVRGVNKVEAVREPSATRICSAVYLDMSRLLKQRRRPARAKQEDLFR